MPRALLGFVLAIAAIAFATVAPAPAQNGPGLPRRSYATNELFTIVSTLGSGNHGRVFVHDGYVGTLRTGSGLQLWDVSDPYAPALVNSFTMGLSEPHTYALTGAYGGEHLVVIRGSGLGGRGFEIWDVTNAAQASRVVAWDVPGVPGGYADGLFWIFPQGRYIYCPAGSLGLFVVDTIDPQNPAVVANVPKSALGGFNTVLAYAIGNVLVLANSDGGRGYALCDISDPVGPVLLHSDATTAIPYSAAVNGGQFLVAAVGNCIGCTGGNVGSFELYDITNSAFVPVGTAGLPSRGGSAVRQDRFVHVAASRSYLKLDLSQAGFPVVGQTPNPATSGDFDWVTPLGNLVALGDDQGGATNLVPHQAAPDATGPEVTMVVPADGAVDQAVTSRVGLTMSDMIDLASLDATTMIVRPVGGQPIAGTWSVQLGIVNFSPASPLQQNTTYEVIVPAGGVRDWAGNATAATFQSAFSTGSTISAVSVVAVPTSPVTPGQAVHFDVANASGPGPLTFSWDFGDGSPPTPYSSATAASHTFTNAGHYSVRVTAKSGSIVNSHAQIQTVHHPVTAVRPARSSTILYDRQHDRVWCVNADNDTVTLLDAASRTKVAELPTGRHPRTLARSPATGAIWVVCEDDATIHLFHPQFPVRIGMIDLPPGSAPYGVAMSPDGSYAYVTLRAAGEVARLDAMTGALVDTVAVGPEPKGLAISADSQRIFATRFLSGQASAPVGEVYELSKVPFAPLATRTLAMDPGPDTENSGRGLPNYLSSLTISPDGRRLWIPSKKDNIERGQYRDGQPLTFESTVRTILSQIDLSSGLEDLGARVDLNDKDLAFAVEFSRIGDYAFSAVMGSNAIDVRDAYTGELVAGFEGTGLAPQGLVLSPDGSTLWVHEFTGRSVGVFDVVGVTESTTFEIRPLASIATVAQERLAPDVLTGKRIFYNAADPRMSEDGYISCASCHLDGGHDGRVWDFTDRGEGLRNTTTLLGRMGLGHGRVHWTANFDEIQDFENDIRNGFGGAGFLTPQQWQVPAVRDPLGQPKAGLSADLDALAAYVESLDSFGRSPHRRPDGSLTAAAVAGRDLFSALGCASCHSGPGFTDSAYGGRHDVGTIKSSSGQASGGVFDQVDTPSLRGLWATAPYLHDGSAATLFDVIGAANPGDQHGVTSSLTAQERAELVAYLLSIDDADPVCRLPGTGEDFTLSTGVDGAVDGHCVRDVRGGQVLRHVADSPGGGFHGAVTALAYEVYTPASPPLPTFPGLHLGRTDAVALALPLQLGGFEITTSVPSGMFGLVLRVQAVVLTAAANNGTYATSAAHDAFLR